MRKHRKVKITEVCSKATHREADFLAAIPLAIAARLQPALVLRPLPQRAPKLQPCS